MAGMFDPGDPVRVMDRRDGTELPDADLLGGVWTVLEYLTPAIVRLTQPGTEGGRVSECLLAHTMDDFPVTREDQS